MTAAYELRFTGGSQIGSPLHPDISPTQVAVAGTQSPLNAICYCATFGCAGIALFSAGINSRANSSMLCSQLCLSSQS